MTLHTATIEIIIAVPDGEDGFAYAADAISETMRPLLQEFGGESFVDWRYREEAQPIDAMPTWAEYQPRTKRIWICCEHCGSRDVTRDAISRWSDEAQDWEACAVLDNTDCEECCEERSLEEVPVIPDHDIPKEIKEFGWSVIKAEPSNAGYHVYEDRTGRVEMTKTFTELADAYCWARANDRTAS